MPIADLSDVRIEYFPHGTGTERVVFLHGFQASARIWSMVQEALPAGRYSSIAINNRGAGGSDAPPDEADFSIAKFANDAFELVTKLGWSNFTLVGHSLGGATAAQFAVDHPKLLKGLVLLDPADPDGREIPGGAAAIDKLLDGMMQGRRAQLAKGGAGDAIDASRNAAPKELMRLLSEDMRNAPERRLRGSMRSMFNIRLGDRVKSLPMKVMLAAGDKDELIQLASMLATWAKYPDGSGLHIWHGIGHSPNLECPGELAALIEKFIG
jgi:pimeloyl-ACP methyl ester carboxylesterase